MVTFAFSDLWLLSMIMMVFIGIGRMGADACGNTLIQTLTDPAVLGRVNSIVMVSFGLGGSGAFIIGYPGETERTIKLTIDFLNESGISSYRLNFFYYSASMLLHRERDKYGMTGLG